MKQLILKIINSLGYRIEKIEKEAKEEINKDIREDIDFYIKGENLKRWLNNSSTGYNEVNFEGVEFFEENILQEIEFELGGNIPNTEFRKSEMSYKERAFINGIIRKAKPKVLVEMGLSAGGSSCVILNAIKDNPESHLYSFDYNTNWYRDEYKRQDMGRKTGFLVDLLLPILKSKWSLYTGGVPSQYFHNLPNEGVDVCLIDTAHFNPGEHLNLLEILPFMKRNGLIIFHDTIYHAYCSFSNQGYTNYVALNSLSGKRVQLKSENTHGLPNIGAVVLGETIDYYKLFTNLSLPWYYLPSNKDLINLYIYFSKYYTINLLQIYVFYSYFYLSLNSMEKSLARESAEKKTLSWLEYQKDN